MFDNIVEFRYGDLARIARRCGVSRQYLSNIVRGRRRANPELAQSLMVVALEFYYRTRPYDWMYPQQTANPLFKRFQERRER